MTAVVNEGSWRKTMQSGTINIISIHMWFHEYVRCLNCGTVARFAVLKWRTSLPLVYLCCAHAAANTISLCLCCLKMGFLPGSSTPDSQHYVDRRVNESLWSSLFRQGLIHLSKRYTFACLLRQIPSFLAYKDTTRMTAHFR